MPEPFPALTQLIPHRGPAVLLDSIVAHEETETTCAALVSSRMQYVKDGRADAALALELMAQAVAVHVGLKQHWSSEEPRAGYVVGVPKMSFFGGDYSEGDPLEITVRLDFHEGPVGRFEGKVECRGVLRAEGILTVFEPPLASGEGERDEAVDGAS